MAQYILDDMLEAHSHMFHVIAIALDAAGTVPCEALAGGVRSWAKNLDQIRPGARRIMLEFAEAWSSLDPTDPSFPTFTIIQGGKADDDD